MTPDDFYAAKLIEKEGWEFLGVTDDGDMSFSRMFSGIIYVAHVKEDR